MRSVGNYGGRHPLSMVPTVDVEQALVVLRQAAEDKGKEIALVQSLIHVLSDLICRFVR